MKDRIVEHPHRYRLVAVPGEAGVYDLEPVPGVVTEVGTALNKASLLSDETAVMLGLSGADAVPDQAWTRTNLSSFQAFCSNINADSLDAAFGKGNEKMIGGLGRQLAMYAWFKGEKETFYSLIPCMTLRECLTKTFGTIVDNAVLYGLVSTSQYALSMLNTISVENIAVYKKRYDDMIAITKRPAMIDAIRENEAAIAALKESQHIISNVGNGVFVVPDNVRCITVNIVGGGGGGGGRLAGDYGGAGGKCGECKIVVLNVSPGDTFNYSVSENGATTFGTHTAQSAAGAQQVGQFLTKGTDGGRGTSYYTNEIDGGYGGEGGFVVDGVSIVGLSGASGASNKGRTSRGGGGGNGAGAGGGGQCGCSPIGPAGSGAHGAIVIYM